MSNHREKPLRELDKRWEKEVDRKADEDTSTYMPHRMEMTKKEFDAHKDTMSKDQRKKITKGLPLYRGARIKVIN